MGYVLSLAIYLVTALFLLRLLARLVIWVKAPPELTNAPDNLCPSVAMSVVDVLFLRRLFLVNKILWVGEWTFHVSFVFVVLRHLRYVVEPVPECLSLIQPLGVFAGYLLPLSLLYILAYRLLTAGERYVSPYNMFLISVLLLIGVTGVLMHAFYTPDLIEVKAFVMNVLAFRRATPPGGILFNLHAASVLVIILWLPPHIMAAPIAAYEARLRDEETAALLHQRGRDPENHEKI